MQSTLASGKPETLQALVQERNDDLFQYHLDTRRSLATRFYCILAEQAIWMPHPKQAGRASQLGGYRGCRTRSLESRSLLARLCYRFTLEDDRHHLYDMSSTSIAHSGYSPLEIVRIIPGNFEAAVYGEKVKMVRIDSFFTHATIKTPSTQPGPIRVKLFRNWPAALEHSFKTADH